MHCCGSYWLNILYEVAGQCSSLYVSTVEPTQPKILSHSCNTSSEYLRCKLYHCYTEAPFTKLALQQLSFAENIQSGTESAHYCASEVGPCSLRYGYGSAFVWTIQNPTQKSQMVTPLLQPFVHCSAPKLGGNAVFCTSKEPPFLPLSL